jgi:hypothetical protein
MRRVWRKKKKKFRSRSTQREGKRFVGAAAGKKNGETGLFLGFYV